MEGTGPLKQRSNYLASMSARASAPNGGPATRELGANEGPPVSERTVRMVPEPTH